MKRKLFYLFSLMLLCIIGTSRASADETKLYWTLSEAGSTITDANGVVTLTDVATKGGIQQGSAFSSGFTETALKLSGSREFQLTYNTTDYTILSVKLYATSNSNSATATVGSGNSDSSSYGTIVAKGNAPTEITLTGVSGEGLRFSAQSLAIIVVSYTSSGAAKHTVTYSLGDATAGTVPTQADVTEGGLFTIADVPTDLEAPAGQEFKCWNDGTNDYDPGDEYTMGTSDVTITAQYQAITTKYTITYDLGGATAGTVPTQGELAEGKTFTVAAVPGDLVAPEGKEFKCWNDGTNDYDPEDVYTVGTSNITLTAIYQDRTYHGLTPISTLDLADSDNETFTTAFYTGNNVVNDCYYDAMTGVAVFIPYAIYQAYNTQTWSTCDASGSSSVTWSASGVFKGSSYYFSSGGRSAGMYEDTRNYYYLVTNCTGVSALVGNKAKMEIHEVVGSTVSVDPVATSEVSSSDLSTISVSDLDASKTYIVRMRGANGTSGIKFYEIAFNFPPAGIASDLTLTSDASVQIEEVGGTSVVTFTTSAAASSLSIESSKPAVATVGDITYNDGVYSATITAVAEGTATITITQDGDETYQNDSKTVGVTVGTARTFTDFKINFLKSWATSITDNTTYYVTATDDEGVPTYSSEQPSEYLATFNGKYHGNSYGLRPGSVFTVPVDGPVKIYVGMSDYGDTFTVTNSNNETVATGNSNGAKFSQDPANVTFVYYDGGATTLTITNASGSKGYCPYIAVEAIDSEDIPAEYTVNFINGETTVSTVKVYEGTAIGSVPAAPTTDANKQFIGWYTATDGTGAFATTATVPTADVNYYANILDITTNNGYVVVDNSGNDGRNGESFKAAVAWANANSGYNVYVPNGTYDLGDQIDSSNSGVVITRNNLAIIGESMDGTIIKAETEAEAESINSATVKINGGVTGTYLQNMTLQNYAKTFNYSTGAERALALWDRGTQTVLKNVYLKGTQDTYYTNMNGAGQKIYYEGGKIEGTVDFICGAGDVYFEGTALHAANSTTAGKTTGDYLTAPRTYDTENFGYVFNNSVITGESSQAGTYYLARAWAQTPRCTFINADYSACAPTSAKWTKMGSFSGTYYFQELTSNEGYTAADVLGETFATSAQTTIKSYYNTVTVGETGFATIGFPYATTLPEGVTGYAVESVANGSVKMSSAIAAGTTIPANTGLVITATPGTYDFTARPDGDEISDNMLAATGSSSISATAEGDFYYFAIINATQKKVGFKKCSATATLGAYKAYLPGTGLSGNTLTLQFAGDATAINGIEAEADAVAPVKVIKDGKLYIGKYNVAGQQVK